MLPRYLPALLAGDGFIGRGDERDHSNLAMLVLSASKAARYVPGPNEVCISIHAHGTAPPSLSPGWAAVLRIECDDTGPYAPTTVGAKSLTTDQGAAIIQFVREHRSRRRLVLHCAAGVSRSRSLACAIAELFGLPYRWTALNGDVLRVMRASVAQIEQQALAGQTNCTDVWSGVNHALKTGQLSAGGSFPRAFHRDSRTNETLSWAEMAA